MTDVSVAWTGPGGAWVVLVWRPEKGRVEVHAAPSVIDGEAATVPVGVLREFVYRVVEDAFEDGVPG